MRRFTGVLLLAACTLLLLPLSFANGLHPLHPTSKHSALFQKSAVIRGLLNTRQSFSYCPGGYFTCEATGCCPGGWNCCRDGNCCDPGSYCVLASNGIIGCCPDGEVCSGPAGDPNTIYPDPGTLTTTNFFTSTSSIANPFTTPLTTSTATRTFTTLVGGPTQTVGEQIVEVSVLDVNITWSQTWAQKTSSCGASITSKTTSTQGSSFTYLFQYSSGHLFGFYYYFNVVNYNTMWEVFINGESQRTFYSYTTDNCTYFESYFPSSSAFLSPNQNLTVVVHGSDSVDPTASGPWSLEVNKFLIREQTVSSTSTSPSLTTKANTPTGFSLNAAGRAQPYQPLLVLGGILLAVLYCA
ncbi:hypothetical protein BYT27DRAFT_7190922 [Phlegmacium glaucopus]|nr:hypothetical protein BYT27DRAFT_7190922 [Phlegmacium glaucopus]